MLDDASLSEQVFGPAALLVRVADAEQRGALATQFRGRLPPALPQRNPLGLWRVTDGELSKH
ncbi:hypothetical protein GCM10027093_71220 [Paraburkholderia jirisanensis]